MRKRLQRLCDLMILCAALAMPIVSLATVEVIGEHRLPGSGSVQYVYAESEEAFRAWIFRAGVYASKDRKPSRESTSKRTLTVTEPGDLIFCPAAFSRRDGDHGYRAAFIFHLLDQSTGVERTWTCLSAIQEVRDLPRIHAEPGSYTYWITENDAHETAFLTVYAGFIPDSGVLRTDTVTEAARSKVMALADRLPALTPPTPLADRSAFAEQLTAGEIRAQRIRYEQKSQWYRFDVAEPGTLLIAGADGGHGSRLCLFADPGYNLEVLRCACTANAGEHYDELPVEAGTYYLYVLNLEGSGTASVWMALTPPDAAEEEPAPEPTAEEPEPEPTAEEAPVTEEIPAAPEEISAQDSEEIPLPPEPESAEEPEPEPSQEPEPEPTVEVLPSSEADPAAIEYLDMLLDILAYYHLEVPDAGPDMSVSDLIDRCEALLNDQGIVLPPPIR